jgi:hypothetical protein
VAFDDFSDLGVPAIARLCRIGSERRVNCSAISGDRRREQGFQSAIGAYFGHETTFMRGF